MTQLIRVFRNSTTVMEEYWRTQKDAGEKQLGSKRRVQPETKGESSEIVSASFLKKHEARREVTEYHYLRTGVSGSHRRITVSQDLTGKVVKTSAYPVAGGSYSDVSKGKFNGKLVAIKAPRIVNVPAPKLAQVSIVMWAL